MHSLFNTFVKSHEEVAKSYDKKVLKIIFKSLLNTIKSTEGREIPITVLIENAKEDLAKKNLSLLNLEAIIRTMMSFLSLFYGFEEDSFENHRQIGEKILWKILARYINNPHDYTHSLFSDITFYFEKSKVIYLDEVYQKMLIKKKYRNLPPEALLDCIEGLFDFFVSKGNIVER